MSVMTALRESSAIPPVARRAVLSAVNAMGEATSPARVSPDFLIVGAQRAGTTSLHEALVRHPAVLAPRFRKEKHYFDQNYARGDAWYRGHFPLRVVAQLRERNLGQRVRTGESTPYYMFHPDVPRRIAEALPGIRVIALLRDPVERAYSQHAHEVAYGFEHEPFERALELEPERLAGEAQRLLADPTYVSFPHQHHSYLSRGEYAGQLAELSRQLGRGHVLVVESADFFARPAETFARILAFLDLPPWAPQEFSKHNARSRVPLAPALARRLDEHFQPHDEQLAAYLGGPPSWRR